MVTLFGMMIFWGVYSFLKQNAAIDAFAADEPLTLQQPVIPEGATAELQGRLSTFAEAVNADREAVLELSSQDITTLIASQPKIQALSPMVRIDNIGDGKITATVSFPMRTLGKDARFLNGTLSCAPKTENNFFFLDLISLEIPGKKVDPGFIESYRRNYHLDGIFLRPFEEDEPIWHVIQSIREVEISDDKITLRSLPITGRPKE